LSIESFAALPQVQGRVMPNRGSEVDDALLPYSTKREVVLSVPYLSAIFPVVASTDCVATVSRRHAEFFARTLPLAIVKHPLSLPKVEVSLNWHRLADKDPAVVALRGLIGECIAERQYG
jgi:DNA-binding transcriptional LysR family regulator